MPTVVLRQQVPGERPQSATELLDAAAHEYRETGIARPVALGSVVAFPFGLTEPVLTCAVLRACIIDLEPGERLVADPIAGDHERWRIGHAPAGPGGANTLVWVKPTDCDLTTSLTLSTDRRIYQVTLDAPACDRRSTNPRLAAPGGQPGGHVTFYFPDSTVPGAVPRVVGGSAARAGAHVASDSDSRSRGGVDVGGGDGPAFAGIAVDVSRLNFDYRVKRDRRFPWAPAQVFDDGAHTFIKIPPEAAAHPAPALFEVHGDDGKALLNYTVRDGYYVTDRTFRRAVLVLGQGKHERRVDLENPRFGRPAAPPVGINSGKVGDTSGRIP